MDALPRSPAAVQVRALARPEASLAGGHGRGLDELRAITDYGDYAHGTRELMIAAGPVKAVARVAGGAVRHAAWWVRYQLHGQTHPAPPEPRKRPAPDRRSAE